MLRQKKVKALFARQLRQRMTPAEIVLWEALRGRRFARSKFRRQVAIGSFVVDFLSYQHRLILEADGGIHDERKDYDLARDEYLQAQRYRILRFRNEQILDNLPFVLQTIEDAIRGKIAPIRLDL